MHRSNFTPSQREREWRDRTISGSKVNVALRTIQVTDRIPLLV